MPPLSPHPRRSLPLRGQAALPWIVLLLAASLRFLRLGAQELRGDEAFSYLFARMPWREIVPTLLLEGDPHSPLHYYLLHGVMALLGDGEWAMRLPSALLGIALVYGLWRLGAETLGHRAGLWMGGLAAIAQGLVWLSQDVRNQPTLATLATVVATLVLLRATRQGGLWRWLTYVGLCALSIYSFYYGVFALVAHGAYLLALPERRHLLPRWLGAMAMAGVLFAPWLLAMWPSMTAAGQLAHPSRPDLVEHLVMTGSWMLSGEELAPAIARGLTVGALALVAVGAVTLWRRDRALVVMLATWLTGALLGMWGVRHVRGTFNVYYAVVAAPAFFLLLVAAVDSLWQRERLGRAAAVSIALLLMSLNAAQLVLYYRDQGAGARSRDYRPMAVHVAAHAGEGDLFLANAPNPLWGYYLRDVIIDYEMQPEAPEMPRQAIRATLQETIVPYERIWFTPQHHFFWDREGKVDHWLYFHALEVQRVALGQRTLHAYVPPERAETAMVPLDQAWDGVAQLRAYHLTVDGLPAEGNPSELTLHPEATVAITWLWEATDAIPENYTVFVHLLGEDGRLLAQHDGVPVWGTRPTTTWEPGDRILDQYELVVPPLDASETATLIVGLYHSETIERVPLPNGDEALPVLELRIGD